MLLSTRQARIFQLAILLSTGLPVSAPKIINQLACSEPTLTRALKALRETYFAEIRYSKATRTYQLVKSGLLEKKMIRRMNETLSASIEFKTGESVSKVYLDKEKKKAVSLSLRGSVLRKIDQLAMLAGSTRSDAVELLVDHSIAEFSATLPQRVKS